MTINIIEIHYTIFLNFMFIFVFNKFIIKSFFHPHNMNDIIKQKQTMMS